MTLFLGIDLGASSVKACLLYADGKSVERRALVRARVQTHHFKASHHIKASHSEQDPADWRHAMARALAQLNETHASDMAKLQGISFSGGAHIGVLCDAKGQPLRRAIMWDDQRAATIAAELADKGTVEALTGNRPNATWTLPQLIWLGQHEPAVLAKTERLYFAKDWLRAQLTDDFSSDATEAVGSMMADKNGAWHPELQAMSGLAEATFAPLLAPTDKAGDVTPASARAFGLPEGVPVYQGAIDTSMEWLCAGEQSDDMASLKLASAGVVAFTSAKPTSFAPVSFYPHIVPRLHYHAAGMSDCMGAIDWVRQTLTPQLGPSEFTQAASQAPMGADGLLFYPYLSGARAPFWDASLSAQMHGLTRGHSSSAIARAAYEGVGHVLTAIWQDMTQRLGQTPTSLSVLGGGSQAAFFCQILADMLNVELRAGSESDCAFATALLAATSQGVLDTVSQAAHVAYQPSAQFTPDKEAHAGYALLHENFMSRHRVSGDKS
jgi:xylulokinase